MSPDVSTLTGDDRAALDLESLVWRYAGAKEDAIRARLGVSPVQHHQRIARLVEDPAASAYAPATVRRLRAVLRRGRPRSATRTGDLGGRDPDGGLRVVVGSVGSRLPVSPARVPSGRPPRPEERP